MAPLALVSLAAVALPVATDDDGDEPPAPWVRQVALSLAIALVYLGALAAYGRKPSAAETAATATVRQLWEPPPAVKSSGRS